MITDMEIQMYYCYMGIYSTSVIGLRLFLLWQKFVFVGKQEHPEKTADLPESSTKFMPESTDKYFSNNDAVCKVNVYIVLVAVFSWNTYTS